MRRDVFVYLSGPITAVGGRTVEQNVVAAAGVYWQLLTAGIPAFCPHLSGAFPTAFTIDYETWIAYDFAVIDRCTHMLMLPHWQSSTGAVRERKYAVAKSLPVAESVEDLLQLLDTPATDDLLRLTGRTQEEHTS